MEKVNENCFSLVKQVGFRLKMKFIDNMINDCHRIGQGKQKNGFRELKNNLLESRKVIRNMSIRIINLEQENPI